VSILVVLPIAFAPGIFWMWYFYRKGIYRPEPRRLIIRTFAAGMAVTIPAAVAEWLLLPEALLDITEMSWTMVGVAAVVGVVEELVKFLAVRWVSYRFFDEPLDGIIYAAAAALGFASVENVVYVSSLGWQVIILRGPLSTLAHVVFAGLWGYPLAKRRMGQAGIGLVAIGLVGGMALHAAFNFFLFTESWPAFMSIILFFVGLAWLLRTTRRAQVASPFKEQVTHTVVACPNCGTMMRLRHNFCTACGASMSGAQGRVQCAHCGSPCSPGDAYCTVCGYRLVD
jgi:RsiW-degrading membrane proteinase PrsW (M82 family)